MPNAAGIMEESSRKTWVARCSHRLREQWRTIDLESLEDLAQELWADERWRVQPPEEAAVELLRRGIPTL